MLPAKFLALNSQLSKNGAWQKDDEGWFLTPGKHRGCFETLGMISAPANPLSSIPALQLVVPCRECQQTSSASSGLLKLGDFGVAKAVLSLLARLLRERAAASLDMCAGHGWHHRGR